MTITGLAVRLAVPTALAFGLSVGTPSIAHASSISFTITDLGTYTGNGTYADTNPPATETFAGQGFLGIYPSVLQNTLAPGLAHLFGLEYYCSSVTDSCGIYSETEMEINVSALAGATITSATLSYDLSDGLAPPDTGQYGSALASESVTATSFAADGTLGYDEAPPSDLGSTTFTSTAQSANSVDVTALLQAVVSADDPWFGLYLTPLGSGAECDGQNGSAATFACEGNYQYTYTQNDAFALLPDAADVRLTVDYIPAPVPEPATLGLTALGALALLWRRRRVGRN